MYKIGVFNYTTYVLNPMHKKKLTAFDGHSDKVILLGFCERDIYLVFRAPGFAVVEFINEMSVAYDENT